MNFYCVRLSMRTASVLCIFGLQASLPTMVVGKPMTFSPLTGQITVPDDWSIKPMAGGTGNFAASATNSTSTESFSVYVSPIDSMAPLSDDSSYIKGFLKTCADHKAIVSKSRHETINGVDFYVLPVVQKLPSMELDMLAWFTLSQGHIYQLSFYQRNADPGKNPDYTKILSSFLATP